MALLILAIFLIKIDISHNYNVQVNPNCDCGVPNIDMALRIVGGSIADAHRYPWMAAIYSEEGLCGGVLISDRYILTAGHCINASISNVQIIALGIHNLQDTEEGEVVLGIESKLHPNYTYGLLRDTNDIALIKLIEPVNYTINIRPVCLPKQDRNYTNIEVQLAGWGVEREGGINASMNLKETTVKIKSLEECANTKIGPYIDTNILCAYSNGSDACQGDSGGPLLLERQQNKYETIGVVSWGFGCAEDSPGAYTKVTNYLDWILSETQDSIYCKDE